MTAELVDHGGHIYGDAASYKDLNVLDVESVTFALDHLVTNSGSVLIRVNGTPLRDLATEPYRHHTHDETGGMPAPGF